MAAEDPKAKDTPAKDTTNAAATDVLTSEVVGSAESYRKLGEIFVSVLAAIPTATLVTTLIRAPGDAGLYEWKLAVGLALAALALIFGVLLAIWLRTPVEVDREALDNFEMERIVSTSQRNYEELLTRIGELQDSVAAATEESKRKGAERSFQAVLATLRSVHLLATADALRDRVLSRKTQNLAGAALIVAAAAVFFLATAPKPKSSDKSTGPTVVKVTLSADGAKKLGCSKTTFNALKLGGSKTEPEVLPLGLSCTAGEYLTLKVAEKEGLATEVKALEALPVPAATDKSSSE